MDKCPKCQRELAVYQHRSGNGSHGEFLYTLPDKSMGCSDCATKAWGSRPKTLQELNADRERKSRIMKRLRSSGLY